MRAVLRQACARFEIGVGGPNTGPAGVRRRMITITPGDAARVVLSERQISPSSSTALRSPRSSSTVASILD